MYYQMSPSLPTPVFLYILNILLSPTLPKFPVFHNCHATPKGHGLPPPQNSERAPSLGLWGSTSLRVNKPPLHCGGVPSHRRPSLVASLHSDGPSHDCGRGTRFWSRWLASRFTSPEVGVIWFLVDGWLGR